MTKTLIAPPAAATAAPGDLLTRAKSRVGDRPWLVRGHLVRGCPADLGGSCPDLLTRVAGDLIVSVAFGVPFLNLFAAGPPAPVAVFADTLGLDDLHAAACRAAAAHRVHLTDAQIHWEPHLPADPDELSRLLCGLGPALAVFDLMSFERDLMEDLELDDHRPKLYALIRSFNLACAAAGATPVYVYATEGQNQPASERVDVAGLVQQRLAVREVGDYDMSVDVTAPDGQESFWEGPLSVTSCRAGYDAAG